MRGGGREFLRVEGGYSKDPANIVFFKCRFGLLTKHSNQACDCLQRCSQGHGKAVVCSECVRVTADPHPGLDNNC